MLCGVSIPGETHWAYEHAFGAPAATTASITSSMNNMRVEQSQHEPKRTPLPEYSNITALVKVYDIDLADKFKTSDVLDMIGLLDVGTLPDANWDLDISEFAAARAPALPCVHTLCVRHAPPLVAGSMSSTALSTTFAPLGTTTSDVRNALIRFLAQALDGDMLMAEYVLLALLGKVHIRRNGIIIGPFSVNLTGLEHVQLRLVETLRQLMPAVVCQPLSVGSLNDPTQPLYVRGTDSGIQAGRLQLAPGTCLILDETKMDEGELNEAGVKNIRALLSLLQYHTLPCVFPYSEMDLPADLVFIILSQGKSILPADVQVHSEAQRNTTQNSAHLSQSSIPSPSTLHAMRVYLAHARQLTFSIPTHVSEQIQNDFVALRRDSRGSFDQNDLQRCLSTARLLSLSHGCTELSADLWQMAKSLDLARASRIEPRVS